MLDATATVAHLPRHRTTDPSTHPEGYAFVDAPEPVPVSARGTSGAFAASHQDVVIASWLRLARLRAKFDPSPTRRQPSPDLAA